MPKLAFDDDVYESILVGIMEGQTLNKITGKDRAVGVPSRRTLYNWFADEELNEAHKLRERYEFAVDVRTDNLFDEILEIADAPPLEIQVLNKHGEVVDLVAHTNESIRNRQLQIDARKWVIGRNRPKKYGDQTQRTTDDDGTGGEAPPTKTIEYHQDPVDSGATNARSPDAS